ncbi:MAG: hypothetical protein H6Q59_1245 [Firmicutes bacterium]|nr:hypothetical protein [Bacillota bacterium]
MFLWNRIEIYRGTSLKEFSELKNSLAVAGIRYDYKLSDHHRPNLNLTDSFHRGHLTSEPRLTMEYSLYVHRKNYEDAMFLTSNRHNR